MKTKLNQTNQTNFNQSKPKKNYFLFKPSIQTKQNKTFSTINSKLTAWNKIKVPEKLARSAQLLYRPVLVLMYTEYICIWQKCSLRTGPAWAKPATGYQWRSHSDWGSQQLKSGWHVGQLGQFPGWKQADASSAGEHSTSASDLTWRPFVEYFFYFIVFLWIDQTKSNSARRPNQTKFTQTMTSSQIQVLSLMTWKVC